MSDGDRYYAFVANDVPIGPSENISVLRILESLLKEGFWAFTEGATLYKRLEIGDRILLYLAGHGRRFFAARARVSAEYGPLTDAQVRLLRSLGLGFFRYSVGLDDIEVFARPVPIKPLVDSLMFIKDKRNYGLNLRAPIIRLSEHDYKTIVSALP